VHEICFSKDGQLVASGSADKTVRLWNGVTGAPGKTLAVGSIVYAVGISPDGKLLASGSFDGFVRLWDTATGRQLLTLLELPAEGDTADWLALTPEGYGESSPGLRALTQWRMAGQMVAAAPVWQVLEQPGTVAKAVHGEKLPAPRFK
jgi:hypothetical protein